MKPNRTLFVTATVSDGEYSAPDVTADNLDENVTELDVVAEALDGAHVMLEKRGTATKPFCLNTLTSVVGFD